MCLIWTTLALLSVYVRPCRYRSAAACHCATVLLLLLLLFIHSIVVFVIWHKASVIGYSHTTRCDVSDGEPLKHRAKSLILLLSGQKAVYIPPVCVDDDAGSGIGATSLEFEKRCIARKCDCEHAICSSTQYWYVRCYHYAPKPDRFC